MLFARKYAFLVLLLLVGLASLLHADQDRNTSDGTCDSDSCADENKLDDGDGVSVPFKLGNKHKWMDFKTVIKQYAKWHNKTLHDASLPCESKLSVVFTPNAGLGDSIGALTGAFSHAVRTGRLFFIQWKPYAWTIGLSPLPFESNYLRAKKLKNPETGKPLLCVDSSRDPASALEGHITREHALNREPGLNDVNIPYDDLMDGLIRPSQKVQKIIDDVLNSGLRPSDQESANTESRTVGLVMRTGQGEYNQFLSEGDEQNFVKCFKNYAAQYAKQAKKEVTFRVFVTSDVEQVKQNAVDELKKVTSGEYALDVVTLSESSIHVMHIKKDEAREKSVQERLRKTYAEFFLISKCQVLFLTHGSLFGRTASEHGVADESDVHFISDSLCDGQRAKYSYLSCHEPKYSKICGFV